MPKIRLEDYEEEESTLHRKKKKVSKERKVKKMRWKNI